MLSVILTILKVIGIVLAVLVGLILLIVLLVGFVPVRYKASGKYPAEGEIDEDVLSRRKRDTLMNKVKASDEKDGEDEYGEHKKEIPLKANAVVSWLLHIVHVSVEVDSTACVITARLFGIFKVYSNDPETIKKKEEKQRKKEEKQRKKEEKERLKNKKDDVDSDEDTGKLSDGKETDRLRKDDSADGRVSDKDSKKSESEKKSDSDKEELLEEGKNSSSQKADSEKKSSEDKPDDYESDDSLDDFDLDDEASDEYKGISGKFKKIADKIKGIGNKIKGIKEKISSLWKKKNYIMDMKDDPRVRSGISYAKDKLFIIIKRVLPKKLEGRVAYGMDDPSTTGKILAGASLFYPIWGGHFEVEPDFEGKRLEVDASLKGRIILALLVIPALKIWFNKDIKYIRRKIRGFKKL